MNEKIRLDKWLWAVRLCKSRTLATEFCKKGRVRSHQTVLKPSHLVKLGDVFEFRKNGFNFKYKILKLIEKRVSFSLAISCYENLTPAEELAKYETWFNFAKSQNSRSKGTGRPTKKDRREMEAQDFHENHFVEEE